MLSAEERPPEPVDHSHHRVQAVHHPPARRSPVDETYLRALAPRHQSAPSAIEVDSDFFRPTGQSSDRSRLVFTGVLSYDPDEDAVLYFTESILPLNHQQNPGVIFNVVGKDPAERVRALQGRSGVEIVAGVPDVRPYLERAGIFVCPLRWGAGVKNKLLAAQAGREFVVKTNSWENSARHLEETLLGAVAHHARSR